MSVKFINNSDKVREELRQRVEWALSECGLSAESYAKLNITRQNAIDTGALRNSITFDVHADEEVVYIGSNLDYAKYVEFGTGQYVKGGRPTPWVFTNAKGETYMTKGMEARPYLKPAITENVKEYQEIIKNVLSY